MAEPISLTMGGTYRVLPIVLRVWLFAPFRKWCYNVTHDVMLNGGYRKE